MIPGRKQTYVGEFFEVLGQKVLGGELMRDDKGDIGLWKEETVVEVKSSSAQSSYGFRLCLDQIDGYEKQILDNFPFSRVWYMFFTYRNGTVRKPDGTRMTEMSRRQSVTGVHSFLSKRVLWGLLVDFELVLHWRRALPHSSMSILGHPGMKTVDLHFKRLHPMTNGGLRDELVKLDLDPDRYGQMHVEVQTTIRPNLLEKYKVETPVTLVLPHQELRFAKRVFEKRRGVRFC